MSKIDRKALVNRHNIVLTEPDKRSPFTVGNGKFGFTADVTGLQTFNTYYEGGQPLCTLSEWGWHSFPRPEWLTDAEYKLKYYKTGDREVGYATGFDGQWGMYEFLRINPHRFHLGQVGFSFEDDISIDDLKDIHQELDMYTGVLSSKFRIKRNTASVTTCSMYDRDAAGVKIKSSLLKSKKASVFFEFPYASESNSASAGFSECDANHTEIIKKADGFIKLKRTMDDTVYFVTVNYTNATFKKCKNENRIELEPTNEQMSFVIEYSKNDIKNSNLTFADALKSSKEALKNYWEIGGIIDFGKVSDLRAKELEDRMVKSMYITRINSCASTPPYESGFTCNASWFGKSHTEMHYWHAAHFAQFSRPELLDISLNSYNVHMDKLEALAKRQGYKGLRLPKMIDGEINEAPSYIAPLLLWEQPHPLMCAELMYRVNHDKSILERYFKLIEGTVEFMLDFLLYNKEEKRYVLDAPYIPAQEFHAPEVTKNAVYELEYWHFSFVI